MDAPTKVSMKGIGVSLKRSYQRPVMTEQVQKPKFWRQLRTEARHSYRRRPGLLKLVIPEPAATNVANDVATKARNISKG